MSDRPIQVLNHEPFLLMIQLNTPDNAKLDETDQMKQLEALIAEARQKHPGRMLTVQAVYLVEMSGEGGNNDHSHHVLVSDSNRQTTPSEVG